MSNNNNKTLQVYSREEVATHSSPDDAWVIIDGLVFDISKFIQFHPGGKYVLTQLAGHDVTDEFYDMHRREVLDKYSKRLVIGKVDDYTPVPNEPSDLDDHLLSKVPFAEASVWQGWNSPYYNDSHRKFKIAVRKFVNEHIKPVMVNLDATDKPPSRDLYKKMGEVGLLAARLAPGTIHKQLNLNMLGVSADEFDVFHELIVNEEIGMLGVPGFIDGLGAGFIIGLPPVIHFAKPELRDRIAPQVISGEKIICLAITEPFAGSDVAGIQCTARLSPCGKFYIVNGVKKWITNGTFADYFVTAVRTGGPGTRGISLLLIERSEGVKTSRILTQYSGSAGTSLITLEDVKVPVGNLLGKENQGFKCIMYNFNHERHMIIVAVLSATRRVIEECFKWASQRKVFGKPLISQPVIRNKLAHMVALVESCHNWLENITFQMGNMPYEQQSRYLAGPIALCKLQSTRVSQYVADQAPQIFGGRAITRTGMGAVVQRFAATQKFGAILGGSEEIMADLGIRQAMKYMPGSAKL